MTDAESRWHAFVWEDGARTLLDPMAGDGDSLARSVNSVGQIVGWSGAWDGAIRAVMWTRTRAPTVSGHGVFGTGGDGRVAFTLSNEKVTFDRGTRFKFQGDVESVTGSGNEATLTGTGSWNGQSGYAFTVSVVDNASWGRNRDTIDVVVRDPAGAIVLTSLGPQLLKQGDISVTPASG